MSRISGDIWDPDALLVEIDSSSEAYRIIVTLMQAIHDGDSIGFREWNRLVKAMADLQSQTARLTEDRPDADGAVDSEPARRVPKFFQKRPGPVFTVAFGRPSRATREQIAREIRDMLQRFDAMPEGTAR